MKEKMTARVSAATGARMARSVAQRKVRGGRRVPLTIGVAHACTVKCRLDEVADARRLEQAPVAEQGGCGSGQE